MKKHNDLSLRDQILQTVLKQYKTKPEYPWVKHPGYAVLRHEDNRKWYAVLMEISQEKLGLSGQDYIDVLNVKVDPVLAGSLLMQKGFLPGYHMNKANWITILLDGSVSNDTIFSLLDMSFEMTQAKAKGKRNKVRITNWLIPANPKYYDIETGLSQSNDQTLLWKQSSNIMVGDTVYLYVAAPVSAIRYKCRAMEVDIPSQYTDDNIRIDRAMRLQFLACYDQAPIGMEMLKQHGVYAVRGPRSIPQSLMEEINVMYGEKK